MTTVVIRGTSGSGKTHIVRALMSGLGPHDSELKLQDERGREKVAGYVWSEKKFSVVGRYDAAGTGGCDTLTWKGAADAVEGLIQELAANGYAVVFEGLIVNNWSPQRLRRLKPIVIILLTTPLDVCLAAVRSRREARFAAKGQTAPPLDESNTRKMHRTQLERIRRDTAAGLVVESLDREAALARAREVLGV